MGFREEADENSKKLDSSRLSGWEKIAGFTCGFIFLIILILINYLVPNPTESQASTFRIILALSSAGFAMVLSGTLDIKGNLIKNIAIKSTSSLAVFVIVFFVNPRLHFKLINEVNEDKVVQIKEGIYKQIEVTPLELKSIIDNLLASLFSHPPVKQLTSARRPLVIVEVSQVKGQSAFDTLFVTDRFRSELIKSGYFRISSVSFDQEKAVMTYSDRLKYPEYFLQGLLSSSKVNEKCNIIKYFTVSFKLIEIYSQIVIWQDERGITKKDLSPIDEFVCKIKSFFN